MTSNVREFNQFDTGKGLFDVKADHETNGIQLSCSRSRYGVSSWHIQ